MLFIEDGAPVIVQGMTGHQGMTHTARMLKAGTNIVGGVNPRKAGTSVTFPGAKNGVDANIPVFATCGEAREATGAKASVVFVPPKFAKSAVVEAVEAGIELIVVITEGIPVADSAYFVELALKKGVRIIGPNCPGLITLGNPGVNLGIIPDGIVGRGPLGLVSKSGTLTYQLMGELSDIGFTACLGAGGDPIVGTTLLEALQAFEADPDTKAVMMIGEIGGFAEQDAAAWAKEHMTKPVVAYIAGFTAPEGSRWATPAPSSPEARAPPRTRRTRSRRRASPWARPRARPPKSCVTYSPRPTSTDRFQPIVMKAVIRQWVRGAIVALASMAIYAVALGCYTALMLLVVSMEEGGDNLTVGTTSLTQAVVLLSEGSGFRTDSFTLTITPLLLTILLIWLINALIMRIKAYGPHAYVAGLIVWLGLNEAFRQSVHLGLVDDQWLVLLKAAIVFSIGFLCAAVPESAKMRAFRDWTRKQVPADIRHCLKIGVALAVAILGIYLAIGLITVIVWSVRNHAAVVSLFELSGMETGSRILTTVAMLIWLPNVMLWAVSWLFGGGFAIGDLASFTLWLGQSKKLPAIPVFGILPEPVSSELWRTVALNAPLAIAALVGLLAVYLPQGFACRPLNVRNTSTRGPVLVSLIYSAGAFCLSAMLISLASTLLFALSNGSLGDHRLAHIGVDVMASTRVVGHSTALGLTAAWLLALIGIALVFPIVWLVERIKDSRTTAATSKTATVHQARFLASQPQESKEEQDDKHEPTDTSSTGLGLS